LVLLSNSQEFFSRVHLTGEIVDFDRGLTHQFLVDPVFV
jgi:hypothetical protein